MPYDWAYAVICLSWYWSSVYHIVPVSCASIVYNAVYAHITYKKHHGPFTERLRLIGYHCHVSMAAVDRTRVFQLIHCIVMWFVSNISGVSGGLCSVSTYKSLQSDAMWHGIALCCSHGNNLSPRRWDIKPVTVTMMGSVGRYIELFLHQEWSNNMLHPHSVATRTGCGIRGQVSEINLLYGTYTSLA